MSYRWATNRDYGATGRRWIDPGVKNLVRRIRKNGSLQVTTMGQFTDDGGIVDGRSWNPLADDALNAFNYVFKHEADPCNHWRCPDCHPETDHTWGAR